MKEKTIESELMSIMNGRMRMVKMLRGWCWWILFWNVPRSLSSWMFFWIWICKGCCVFVSNPHRKVSRAWSHLLHLLTQITLLYISRVSSALVPILLYIYIVSNEFLQRYQLQNGWIGNGKMIGIMMMVMLVMISLFFFSIWVWEIYS